MPAGIYRINLDSSPPSSYGQRKTCYNLKTDHKLYEPLVKGLNACLNKITKVHCRCSGYKSKRRA